MSRPVPSLPERLIENYGRFGVTGRVLLAVSGGADSMALLRGTLAISGKLAMQLFVAHFDHGLRPESADEALWVTAQGNSLGLDVVTERAAGVNPPETGGAAVEETARRLRYEFLVRTATTRNTSVVVTAHTADDRAETVLFHVLRGTGLRGLRGIPRRRRLADGVTLLRPMLDVTRAEVEAYLASIGQASLVDPSNTDMRFTRNRLRHEILPQLRSAVNPRLDAALGRLAQQASEASAVIGRLAARELRVALIESGPELIRLRSKRLATCPRPVIREAIARAWRDAGWPRQRMGFAHWEAIAEVVISGGRRTLPGGTDARRRRGELILRRPAT